jgi:ABC-type glycerol-3-phosphate transport system substrate-binding protein
MRHSARSTLLVTAALAVAAVATIMFAGGASASSARIGAAASEDLVSEDENLTVWAATGTFTGLTKAALKSKSTAYSWYYYYRDVWDKKFPNLKIKEVLIKRSEMTTKVLLAVSAGNPPDLTISDTDLGLYAKRNAVENLDKYYAAARITPGMFLPGVLPQVRVDEHWYAIPASSNPMKDNILYIPKLVKAAGWDPNKVPKTWQGLWEATKKVTQWQNGKLVRIGEPVLGFGTQGAELNLFCGRWEFYNTKTKKLVADSPCIRAYFAYQKRLIDFYGGPTKYAAFIGGDPSIWNCSPKAYIPTGKIVFPIDAWWSGTQMDNCFNVDWRLGAPPTPHGTVAEWRALSTPAWTMIIPRGAKNPQLAFDFAKTTFFDYGQRLGATTNGFVMKKQAKAWAAFVVKAQAKLRKKNGYPGNPMAKAAPIVLKGARLGKASIPPHPFMRNFEDVMARAWDAIAYGKKSIPDALKAAQKEVDQYQ